MSKLVFVYPYFWFSNPVICYKAIIVEFVVLNPREVHAWLKASKNHSNQPPFSQVRFCGFPAKLLCDEVVQTMAEFTNCSDCHLENLYIATPNPEFFTFGAAQATSNENPTTQSSVKCNSTASNIRRVSEVPIPEGSLAPGYTTKLPVWIHGHKKPGRFKREALFYYQSSETNSPMRWGVSCCSYYQTVSSLYSAQSTSIIVGESARNRSLFKPPRKTKIRLKKSGVKSVFHWGVGNDF